MFRERNCRSSHFILSSGLLNSFHSLSREMVVAPAALTESGGMFERWELVIHPSWVLAQCCLSHWRNLPSPGGRGSRRLGWGHGERKRVAELVVLTHVFYCGCCCSYYNVPITTHLDSLIKMLKFSFWLCSDTWAEDQGPCVLPLALGSLRLKRPQGVRAPWPWDLLDPFWRSLAGPVSRDSR